MAAEQPAEPESESPDRTSTRAPTGLLGYEVFWRDHYEWLEEQGYTLRERYRPGWAPKPASTSWNDPNMIWSETSHLIDATRKLDGKRVMLKRIKTSVHPYEVEINRFFSTEPIASHPRNHCAPLYTVIPLPNDPDQILLVMPYLHPFDSPRYNTVGEVVDAVEQIFEGLCFMHQCHVAHRDCGILNIMFDAEPMFPNSYHPVRVEQNLKSISRAKHYSRTFKPIKYFLIDFGLSKKYEENEVSPREDPILGGDKTVPEFRSDQPYDPFPTDVYYIGNVVRQYILKEYKGADFLWPLINDMVQDDPQARPTMDEVISRFGKLKKSLSWWKLRSRLEPAEESNFKRVYRSVAHVFKTLTYIVTLHPAIPNS